MINYLFNNSQENFLSEITDNIAVKMMSFIFINSFKNKQKSCSVFSRIGTITMIIFKLKLPRAQFH